MVLIVLMGTSVVAAQTPGADVDFATDIHPILERHCVGCHGPEMVAGGLRLDSHEHAQEGGFTGLPVLGGTLETNELLRRVSSEDATYRMPKGLPGLTAEEVSRVREWVGHGTPWSNVEVEPDEPSQDWIEYLSGLADQVQAAVPAVPFFRYFIAAFLLINVAILLVDRRRTKVRQAASGASSASWITRIGWPHYVILWGVWGIALFAAYSFAALSTAEQKIVDLENELDKVRFELSRFTASGRVTKPSKEPPILERPEHPVSLSQTYYRGNCERNSRLFNEGNYRTATMTVSLRDSQSGEEVAAGGDVSGRALMVRFELQRAPGTSDALYSEALMRTIFLSGDYYGVDKVAVKSDLLSLTTVEKDWRWQADVPIGTADGSHDLDGKFYVYQGRVNDEKVRAVAHYAISWNVKLDEGLLQPTSDVWMGVIFKSPRVPFAEWFSHDPIPEITGENSKDPELLGIPEHLGRQADDQDAKDNSDQAEAAPE